MAKGAVLNRLSEDWSGITEIVIYGFGRVAQRNIKKLSQDFHIKYIIDNNPNIQENAKTPDYEVKNFQQVRHELGQYKIIVATAEFAYESIKRDLESIQLREYQDFCRIEVFFAEWYWNNKNMVCLSQVTASVTSGCTFNCRHCVSLMPYFKEQYTYAAETIISDLAALFHGGVDYLASYYLVGGEPLLNKDLGKIIETVYKKFGERIGCIQIISNGSIIPDEHTLDILKQCHVDVRLSDYTETVPYQEKFEQAVKTYQSAGIEYIINKFPWVDLGFPNDIDCEWKDRQELKAHMLHCSTGCHALNDQKFYYCGTLFFAEKSGLYELKEDDFVNLSELLGSMADKERILKYCLGETEKGYISLCQYCRGFGSDNKRFVRMGEQMERIYK
ncbi:MAG: radical SAM protein [Ruminococcus sp.]|nr:radical SAM protein [Ruminococcus sp.]